MEVGLEKLKIIEIRAQTIQLLNKNFAKEYRSDGNVEENYSILQSSIKNTCNKTLTPEKKAP